MGSEEIPKNQVWYYAPSKVTLYTSTNVRAHTFYNGKGVLTFASNVTTVSTWFRGITTITGVKLPSTVTTIAKFAFHNCTSLSGDFDLPNLTTLNVAFVGTAITSFSAPKVTQIKGEGTANGGANAGVFMNCKSLKWVSLPKCTDVQYKGFQGCTALETISLSPSLTAIGQYAFYNCTSLTGDLVFNSLVGLENFAFQNTAITSFTATKLSGAIAGNLANPQGGTFYQCKSLHTVNLPKITTVRPWGFGYDTALANVTLNWANITTLERGAFINCPIAGHMELPKITTMAILALSGTKITSLRAAILTSITGSYASPKGGPVSDCKSLTHAIFPSVSSIGYYAFGNCTTLTNVDFSDYLGTTIPTVSYVSGAASFQGLPNSYQILVPAQLVTAWKAASIWSSYYASHVVGEIIPSDEIWYYAASQVTLYDSTNVSDHTFSDGKGVITLSGNITAIKPWLRGTAVERVKFSTDVLTIEDYAFAGCTTLKGVINTLQVTTIGDHAFDGCTAMLNTNIAATIRNTVTIGDYAFANSSVTSATIPVTVTSLGDGVFSGCTSMTTFTMTAGGLASIPEDMFNGCVKLATVTISDVTSIGDSAFEGCVKLASIAMPATLAIGASAFKDCTILATLNFSAKADTTIPSLGTDALSGIAANFVVNVPAALETDWQADADWVDYASHIVGV